MSRVSQLALDLYGQRISEDTINRFRKPCHGHLERFEEQFCQALKEPEATSTRGWKQRYARILSEARLEHPHTPAVRRKGRRGRTAKPPVNNLIERFENHREHILRFLADNAVPFTNNQGERDLRMAKVQQKISGAFRTWDGARRFARIRSYVSTAQKHAVSIYDALLEAIRGRPMFCQ